MKKVTGWDTNGVNEVGVLEDGRVTLQFAGREGEHRKIFIPREAAYNLVVLLSDLFAKLKTQNTPGSEADLELAFILKELSIGADEQQNQFSLILTTVDDLQLRYTTSRETVQSLAAALNSVLDNSE